MPPKATTATPTAPTVDRDALLGRLRVAGVNRDRIAAELDEARDVANAAMIEAIRAGVPYQAIAEAAGVTKGRVGQLASSMPAAD